MKIKELEKFLKKIEGEKVSIRFEMADSAVTKLIIERPDGSSVDVSPKVFITGKRYLEIGD